MYEELDLKIRERVSSDIIAKTDKRIRETQDPSKFARKNRRKCKMCGRQRHGLRYSNVFRSRQVSLSTIVTHNFRHPTIKGHLMDKQTCTQIKRRQEKRKKVGYPFYEASGWQSKATRKIVGK